MPLGEVADVTPKEKLVTWCTRTAGALQVPNVGISFIVMGLPLAVLPAAVGAGNIGMAPIAHSNENQITDIASMEETFEEMKKSMDRYGDENKRLKGVIDSLKESVGGMEQSQNALDTITKQQNQSIDEFEEQVEHQKKLLAELKEDAKSGVLQTLLTVIVAADSDGDFTIDPEEIDPLIEKIEGTGQLGVNHELFQKKVIQTGGKFQAILDMCRQIMDENADQIPEDEKILWLVE